VDRAAPAADHAEPLQRAAKAEAPARTEPASGNTEEPYGRLLNERPEVKALDAAGRMLNARPAARRMTRPSAPAPIQRAVIPGMKGRGDAAEQPGGPVVQLRIKRENKFAEEGELAGTLAKLEAALAKDPVVGALYADAVADRSDITFTTGAIGAEIFGGTVIRLGGTNLKTEQHFLDFIKADPRAVSRRLDILIQIDHDEVVRAAAKGVDVLQALAHEYGVHATRDFAFVGGLRRLQNDRGALEAFISKQLGGTGPQSEDAHHADHAEQRHGEYNQLSASLLGTLKGGERDAFTASEDYDRDQQRRSTGAFRLARDSEQTTFKFKPKKKKGKSEEKERLLEPAEGSSSGSCCFITTACVRAAGLPDDCEELTALRWFRDVILLGFEAGRALGALYYQVSPGIVAAIAASPLEEEIYRRLFGVIRTCVAAIKRCDFVKALHLYVGAVLLLMQLFPQAKRAR
jgi:hypothetical protein